MTRPRPLLHQAEIARPALHGVRKAAQHVFIMNTPRQAPGKAARERRTLHRGPLSCPATGCSSASRSWDGPCASWPGASPATRPPSCAGPAPPRPCRTRWLLGWRRLQPSMLNIRHRKPSRPHKGRTHDQRKSKPSPPSDMTEGMQRRFGLLGLLQGCKSAAAIQPVCLSAKTAWRKPEVACNGMGTRTIDGDQLAIGAVWDGALRTGVPFVGSSVGGGGFASAMQVYPGNTWTARSPCE